jgi:hypothetical protein
MKRRYLVAAVSLAPLWMVLAGQAHAVHTISSAVNTPVATATANNGAPDDVDVASGGSIGLTQQGVALTLNSNNVVTNEGQIGFTAINNAVAIQVQGGFKGSVTSSGSILVTDNYTPNTDNNTGLLELPFAQGTNRTGIQVVGPGVFTGSITNTGTITVHGDSSFGVDIQAPITGDYQSLQVTAASGSTAATDLLGTITVLGGEPPLNGVPATGPVIGFHVAPTGGVGGNITLGNISATGYGAQGANIGGTVGGALALSGQITSTGYRATTRSSFPTVATQYTAQEMEQGGSAVVVGGSVGGGIVISAPPLDAITNASTASDLINGVSIPQIIEATGSVTTFGSAPALVIGSATNSLTVGVVNPAVNTIHGPDATTNPAGYGLVLAGTVAANGVFDQLNYPNLPAPVSATAIQVGGGGGFAAVINGGVYNTGAIGATAYQADATTIHFLAGGSTPLIVNDGQITASSIQENSAATVVVNTATAKNVTVPVVPVNVYGVLIEQGATVTSIINNSGLTANITGTGGVGGTAGAIIDRSGSLANVTNTGSISAQATQTLLTSPMPVTVTAIDMSAGTGPQTITQSLSTNPAVAGAVAYNSTISYNPGQIVTYNGLVYQATTAAGVSIDPVDYPNFWRQIGASSPLIDGSIYFGSGGSTLTVNAGTVTSPVINLGTGANTVTVGSAGSAATVIGAIEEVAGGPMQSLPLQGDTLGTLRLNVVNGTLVDLNPHTIYAQSVNVGANGNLVVAADPANHTNTEFITSGSSTFASGARVGLSLLSFIPAGASTFTILQTTGAGTLSVGTFGSGAIGDSPWLYSVAPTATPDSIEVTVAQKSQAELGFNNAEQASLAAVIAAAPANKAVEAALLSQSTEAGFKGVYDQLVPSQGQGLFEALEAATQAEGAMVGVAPEASSRQAGTSLWLQEVNDRVDRSTTSESLGSFSKLFGVVGGYEHAGIGGGALGLTLAYFNVNQQENADQIGTGTVASMVEAGAYYRRAMGRFTFGARAAVGYSWFSDNRVFAAQSAPSGTNPNSALGTELQAHSTWGGLFYDAHVQGTYEQPLFGRFYARPEISADFLELNEGAHSDTGGGNAFDLNIASRNSHRASGQAVMVLGHQWGQATWLRAEFRGGYREIFSGSVGDTTASFNGGNPFTLAPENDKGGWYTAGFSIKGGSQYSYLALEGDIDFRSGEQQYDVRIAGRSIF